MNQLRYECPNCGFGAGVPHTQSHFAGEYGDYPSHSLQMMPRTAMDFGEYTHYVPQTGMLKAVGQAATHIAREVASNKGQDHFKATIFGAGGILDDRPPVITKQDILNSIDHSHARKIMATPGVMPYPIRVDHKLNHTIGHLHKLAAQNDALQGPHDFPDSGEFHNFSQTHNSKHPL